ncbi:MAG: potassium channel family protein [Pseudomonadales bacterium]|nr:two pore domain potassium channel family protein [Pseudomonadales bacterium]
MAAMDYAVATLLSVFLIALCVTVHYETLRVLSRRTHSPGRHRWLILVTVYSSLAAHIVEIWIFGAGYWVAVNVLELGGIVGITGDFDFLYYSAMVYTTVGFGDLVPVGPIRMITSTEALAGLALITWSASFTFLQMQRIWHD